ncbi:tyrosine-protein phosphatase [Streptomyces sp. CA2R106]|uniref:tyrosine-protein phosphatase n=1 Tax=Streptomyces sp. CA2R106 TaxID=3120153 RepID=UPI00300B54E4
MTEAHNRVNSPRTKRAALAATSLLATGTLLGTFAATDAAAAAPAPTSGKASAKASGNASGKAAGNNTGKPAAKAVPFTAASVTAGSTVGTLKVSWASSATHVSVYAGATADAQRTLVGSGAGTATLTVSGAHGNWVRLVPSTGAPLTLTIRDLDLASDPNLRDAGGYRTTDGHWVKMGAVYRSAALSLTPADAVVVNSFGITLDADLRTPDEVTAAADVVPIGAAWEELNISGTQGTGLPSGIDTEAAAEKMMQDGEVSMASSLNARTDFGKLLTQIAGSKGATLYHCSAGKDRTGWASALLLSLLGVSKSTVTEDYLLSNTYSFGSAATQSALKSIYDATYQAAIAKGATSADATAAAQNEEAVYTAFMKVETSYLDAGLDYVTAHFGTVENYATTPLAHGGLGLTRKNLTALRTRMLTS